MTDLFHSFDDLTPPLGDYLAAIRFRLRDPATVEHTHYEVTIPPPLIGYRLYPEPVRPMPQWLRDDLYYSAMVRKPMLPCWVAGLT